MEKKIFFSKIWFAPKTAKTFFAAIILLNLFSSFFHQYYSLERSSAIYTEGNIIVYNSSNVKNDIASTTNYSTTIHLEGNALLYDRVDSTNSIAPKELLTSKNKNKGKLNQLQIRNKFHSEKSKITIKDLNESSDILFCFSGSNNNFAINTQNFNENFAVNDGFDIEISFLRFLEEKLSNSLFSEKMQFSFFSKDFSRPPPFLV